MYALARRIKTLQSRHASFVSPRLSVSCKLEKTNVMLMGPPGSGKTTIGPILAKYLGKKFLDVDEDWLEIFWGNSVAAMLNHLGDDRFIEAEGNVVMQHHPKNCVVSLSGSNPLNREAMKHLSSYGVIVYLDTPFQTILNRMHQMKVNRIAGQKTKSLEQILAERHLVYETSYDYRIIITDGETPEAIAERIVRELAPRQFYSSTRGWTLHPDATPSFLQIIRRGLAPDGGLFVPAQWAPFNLKQLERLVPLTYQQRAQRVMERFPIRDLNSSVLHDAISRAYSTFDTPEILPVTHLMNDTYLMEMDHGPTASFKDFSLQLTPKILTHAVSQANQKIVETNELTNANDPPIHTGLLVATSGDTGTAALDGFGREGIPMVVLFPKDGVSPVQRAQMATAPASSCVIGVDSDFDFCQATVKNLLKDESFLHEVEASGLRLTSANSLNFGRLLPQAVFLVSAYCDLVKKQIINMGDEVDVTIPTGNCGNILGAYFAKTLGVPIHNLICASNSNNIMHEVIRTGLFDIGKKTFQRTLSPAIDILVPSNLERFLYFLLIQEGHPPQKAGRLINQLYSSFDQNKYFTLQSFLHHRLAKEIKSGWCDETQCLETMQSVFQKTGRMIDPHTAVAVFVADQWVNTARPMLIASTANFGKFPEAVLAACSQPAEGDLKTLFQNPLFESIPQSLKSLTSKPIIHNTTLPADPTLIREQIKQYFALYNKQINA